MPDNNLNANGEIGLDVTRARKALNDLITQIALLKERSPEAAAGLDKIERAVVGIVGSLNRGTASVQQQRTALQQLVAQYNQLQRSMQMPAVNARGGMGSTVALGQQRAREIEAARLAQRDYNNYVTQSNARIQAAEIAAVRRTQQTVRAEREASFRQAQVIGAAQTRAIAENARRSQQSAYDSYASNIRYSQSIERINGHLSQQRYALYDVAATMGAVSAATLGAAAASLKISIDYEKAFSSVERTTGLTGAALGSLRDNLIELSTTIPLAFSDISSIASLAGQLGIADDAVDDFTKTVAQFSATTNVTVDAAATGLGRLAQLTGVYTADGVEGYNKLGSAILQTGLNAVATESQILGVASQIATSADLAGFTAQEVVALASAFASLGVAPERARGTTQRVFGEIEEAVKGGGLALENFSRVSGIAADELKAKWGTQGGTQFVFSSLINGLKQAAEEGYDTNAMLKDLGIGAVRDIQALQVLANNTSVYAAALKDSNEGYAEGTALQENYAITAATVASQLQVLANTLKAIVDASGGGALGALSGVLEVLQSLAKAVLAISQTGAGQVFSVLALGAAILVGGILALRAASALATASLYAMKTAGDSLAGTVARSGTGIGALARQLGVLTIGMNRATAASTAFSAAQAGGAGRIAASVAGMRAATGAANGLATSLRGLASATGIGLALTAAIGLFTHFAQKQQEAKARVDELSSSLDAQTGAITENTRVTAVKALQDSGVLEAANRVGFSLDLVTDAALGSSDAFDELMRQATETTDRLGAVEAPIGDYNKIFEGLRGTSLELADAQEQARQRTEAMGESLVGAVDGGEMLTDSLDDAARAMSDLVDAEYSALGGTVAMQNALFNLGESLYANGNSFDAFSISGRENLTALQAVVSAMATASGGDATVLATHIAGLMQSLQAYGVQAAGGLEYLSRILASLTGGKGVQGLQNVGLAADMAGNGLKQGFATGANKAAKAATKTAKSANKAAKEIRTLSDYVSDLSNVFSQAFEFRFGLGQALDDVSESWAELGEFAEKAAEDVRDAAQAIVEADAKIRNLTAANQTLEYQLIVAREYGDTLRANEILAEMAENSAELSEVQSDRAKATRELSKAQDATAKSLTGDTDAARQQRAMVLGLVESYRSQVQALANTGMTQDQLRVSVAALRAQFVAQLTQMGYNREEVEMYALAFDDLTAAINRVPRNLTVTANTDPAQRAIDELLARNSNRSVGISANVGDVSGGSLGNFNAGVIGAGQITTPNFTADKVFTRGATGNSSQLNQLAVSTGGLIPQYLATGGPSRTNGPKGTDTIPAWLTPGEYVQRKRAVDYYGLPFMNALNNMQIPRYLAGGGPAVPSSGASGGGIQLVELLPTQIQQIVQAVSTQIVLDGKVVASTVNQNNVGSARRGSN